MTRLRYGGEGGYTQGGAGAHMRRRPRTGHRQREERRGGGHVCEQGARKSRGSERLAERARVRARQTRDSTTIGQ